MRSIVRITSTYHAWRGQAGGAPYADVPGFCSAVTIAEIEHGHDFALAPARYVEVKPGDGVAERAEIDSLAATVSARLAETEAAAAEVRRALGALGYE